MYRSEQSGASFALGVMTGAVIGAGFALLFAPKTGTEMRQQLGEQYRGLADRVGETTHSLRESAQHLRERGRENMQRLTGQTPERVSGSSYDNPVTERFPSSVPSV
jgi:gas vesicle protein